MHDNIGSLRSQVISVGKRLYDTGIAVARSGNISCRLDGDSILITGTGTFLGTLQQEHIVRVTLVDGKYDGKHPPSSELPMHSLIYKTFPCAKIIHAHPPLINGYFAVEDSIKPLTFETTFYLGDVPVIPQETPTVTDPAPVIEALKNNNVVVLKNHGIIAIGDTFENALSLVETLEEAVKAAAIARLFKKESLDPLDRALKADVRRGLPGHPMFSREHIESIVELVNNDAFIAAKGRELNLTLQLAIKLDGSDAAYRFSFEQGRVARLDASCDAPFIISADRAVWESVFLGKLDPFVAVTQGKMKLQGQLGQLSRWYVPFSRLFQIFKEVPFA